MQGIRAAVYKRAEQHLARYFGSQEKTFYYDDKGDLLISALFMPTDRAEAEHFQSSLNLWYLDNHLTGLEGKVHVEKAIKAVQQSDIPLDSSASAIPVRVFLSDYKGQDSDSPMSSLDDFRGTHASSETSPLDFDDDLVKYQSLEKPECFRSCRPYRLHIMDKAKCSENLRHNPNNLLAGSWTPFHQFFDGLATNDGGPKLAIRFVKVFSEPAEPGKKRKRVELALEFQDEESAKDMVPRLKVGSCEVKKLEWQSFVHVEDPVTFQKCIEWKYQKTKEEWNAGPVD